MGKESGAKVVELQCVEETVEFWSSRGFVRTRKGKQCTYAAGEGYVHMSASVQSVMTAILTQSGLSRASMGCGHRPTQPKPFDSTDRSTSTPTR